MRAVPRAASVWLSEAHSATSLDERPDRICNRSRIVIAPQVVSPGISRLVRSADFERVLRTRTRVNSAHFAIHHVAASPSRPAKPARKATHTELSTGDAMLVHKLVDDSSIRGPISQASVEVIDVASGVWLGFVVPKRHAKRSVTRTLIKRQIRAVVLTHAASIPHGLLVVRLRAPFDRSHFVSAASDALRNAAHAELDGLMISAAERMSAGR
jgi:ribonuclease P protein component